jgi:hypothetical protein
MLMVTTPEAVPRRCSGQVGGEDAGGSALLVVRIKGV